MPRPQKRPVGRPVSTGRGQSAPRVMVRLSEDEYALIASAADADGQTVAAYVRDAALGAADRAVNAYLHNDE